MYWRILYLWSLLCSLMSFTVSQLLTKLCQSVGYTSYSRASRSSSVAKCALCRAELLFDASPILYRNVRHMVDVPIVKMPTPSNPPLHFRIFPMFSSMYRCYCVLLSHIHPQTPSPINTRYTIVGFPYSQLHIKFCIHHFGKVYSLQGPIILQKHQRKTLIQNPYAHSCHHIHTFELHNIFQSVIRLLNVQTLHLKHQLPQNHQLFVGTSHLSLPHCLHRWNPQAPNLKHLRLHFFINSLTLLSVH